MQLSHLSLRSQCSGNFFDFYKVSEFTGGYLDFSHLTELKKNINH